MVVMVCRLMVILLIMTIQVNLVLSPSKTWRRIHKFARNVVITKFAINLRTYHHNHLLAATFDVTFFHPRTFSQLGFLYRY